MKLILFIVLGCVSVKAAPFQNLGFEAAVTNNVGITGNGTVADLLPGWGLFNNGTQIVNMRFNYPLEGTGVTLNSQAVNGSFYPNPFGSGYYLLFSDFAAEDPQFSLRQTAEVPPLATVLRYTTSPFQVGVKINGTAPDLLPYSTLTNLLFDVSQFSGQTVNLEFVSGAAAFLPSSQRALDEIEFIPEPDTSILVAIGFGALFIASRRRLQHRPNRDHCIPQPRN